MSRIEVAPRAHGGAHVRLGVPIAALAFALAVGGGILAIAGNSPIEAYRTMFVASLNGWTPLSRSLTLATPLILTGLAAALAFRMKIYNIGAEGQLYLGAIASSWLALALPASLPRPLMLLVLLMGGALAGAIWAGLAAIPRAYLNADEIITTLMLNFIALSLMNYLIFGSMTFWRDPSRPVPGGKKIPESAQLPGLSGRLHVGIIIAVVCAFVLWWVLRRTSWGFQLRTIGDSPEAARYAGMNVNLKVLAVLAISGALAGLAGAIEVSGVTKGLEPRSLATDIGFTGIIVAVIARTNPLGVVPVALFLAAITTSGSALQTIGIQVEVILLLQGLIFLSVTAGEFFVSNRVRLKRSASVSQGKTAPVPS